MIVGQMQMHSDRIRQVFSAEEAEDDRKNGRISGILTIEGPAGFGFDPEMLEVLSRVGFRISTLGWNEKNCLIGSHMTGGGLTDLGRVYVREAQRCGILVDVSHCSDEGFWDIVKVTQKPILASHSNSRAVCDHTRNLTDDMFRAIAETGGVAGLNLCTAFVGEDPTIDTLCDHVLHWLALDPEGTHIALGGDLDGCHHLPAGFDGVQSYPALAQQLLRRGVGERIVRNIFWNNAMEVFSHAVPVQ